MKKILFALSIAMAATFFTAGTAAAQTKVKQETKTSTHKKKDALIGAGAGAVTGAVVSHKHAKGAVIGSAVGAGAGYLLGRHKDKKNPPKKVYKYKKTSN